LEGGESMVERAIMPLCTPGAPLVRELDAALHRDGKRELDVGLFYVISFTYRGAACASY